jgi:predicted transcriptional regulator
LKIVGENNVLDIKDIETLKKTKVRDAMKKKLITARPRDGLEYIVGLMDKHDINRVMIVSDKRNLVGIVARDDVIRGMMRMFIREAIEREELGRVFETDIDKILFLIRDKPIEIDKISKETGIEERKIEEWARILEAHGLVDIGYSAIGKPILRRRI